MVRIEEHLKKIERVDEQIASTKSWKRRSDLKAYKRRLLRELATARQFLGEKR